jgi:hypothetical protein
MPAIVNGSAVPVLIWVINALFSLVIALIGLMLKMHSDSDAAHHARTEKEIEKLRERLHNHGNRVAEVIARLRWIDEDANKK